MLKQNASCDASFWINTCASEIEEHLTEYFHLFATTVVADEIRYPLQVLGIQAQSSLRFNQWVQSGQVILQDPKSPVEWFQPGENAAIGLALEQGYLLLMDDANPYHRARAAGLKVIGTAEFVVLLFDHKRINYDTASLAIKRMRTSREQKRDAFVLLEHLARRKGK
jgi:predicted nucleic acid-binding protein